jgi:hypothetical protein
MVTSRRIDGKAEGLQKRREKVIAEGDRHTAARASRKERAASAVGVLKQEKCGGKYEDQRSGDPEEVASKRHDPGLEEEEPGAGDEEHSCEEAAEFEGIETLAEAEEQCKHGKEIDQATEDSKNIPGGVGLGSGGSAEGDLGALPA